MPREIAGFREQYEIALKRIEDLFPNAVGMLTTAQAAEYLGCNIKTVIKLINKKHNPLPAKDIGIGRTVYRVPIANLVRWSIGGN